jgi:DNA-binding transcriptional regulator YdaS (Cro superfamily)
MNLKTYITSGERGTATNLASLLGVSPSYLSQMASGTANISPERGVQIEKATKGQVSRRDLFPDNWKAIWPELEITESA